MGRRRLMWTAEVDRRIRTMKRGEARELADALGVSLNTIRRRSKELAELVQDQSLIAAAHEPQRESVLDSELYRRRMPGWLLPPVEKAVENS